MEAARHAEQQGVPLPKLALKHSIKTAVDADIAITLVGMSSPEEVCTPPVSCPWASACITKDSRLATLLQEMRTCCECS